MKSRAISVIVFVWFCLLREAVTTSESIAVPRGFSLYRTVSITQRSCNCPMSFSCSCCQNVIILYTKMEKNLCINFTYQRNGLNVDVSLSSNIISIRTITGYKAFHFCVYVPGCLFSTACINILELNQFPRSITACLRLDIFAKKRLWRINYDCISISTELPTNAITGVIDTRGGGISTTENGQMREFLTTETVTGDEQMTMSLTTAFATSGIITDTMATRMSEISTEQTGETIEQTSAVTEMIGMTSEQTGQMIVD